MILTLNNLKKEKKWTARNAANLLPKIDKGLHDLMQYHDAMVRLTNEQLEEAIQAQRRRFETFPGDSLTKLEMMADFEQRGIHFLKYEIKWPVRETQQAIDKLTGLKDKLEEKAFSDIGYLLTAKEVIWRPPKIETTKEAVKTWEKATTDPKKHDENNFRYMVVTFREPFARSIADVVALEWALTGLEIDPSRWMNPFEDPQTIAARPAISASYISQDKRATLGHFGLLVDVPAKNIMVTATEDIAYPYYATNAWVKDQLKKTVLMTPERLLEKTSSSVYNEVALAGTHPSDTIAKVKVVGIYIKVDDTGMPLIPITMVSQLESFAKLHGLPAPIFIRDASFRDLLQKEPAQKIPGYRYWQIARDVAEKPQYYTDRYAPQDKSYWQTTIKDGLRKQGLDAEDKDNIKRVEDHLEIRTIMERDEARFFVQLKTPPYSAEEPLLTHLAKKPGALSEPSLSRK